MINHRNLFGDIQNEVEMSAGSNNNKTLISLNVIGNCYLLWKEIKAGTEWRFVLCVICANRTIFSEEPQNRLNITQNYNVILHTRTYRVRTPQIYCNTITAHD